MTIALEVSDLHKTYSNGFTALDSINLKVEKGDFFALLGPNGAGKSTLLGIISSLVNKSTGTVRISGHDLETDSVNAKKRVGVVPQEFNFNVFERVIDIVIQQAGYYGISGKIARENAEFYLKALDLWDKRNTPSRMLSGGMKRRLMIARALVHKPDILILDEPTAGVDVELRRSMWTFLTDLNQQGVTIILTTHYLEEAESLAKTIAIINHGKIIEHSSKRELLKKSQKQTYIVELDETVETLPEILSNFELLDGHTLLLSISQNQALNTYMQHLVTAGLKVQSIRPKSNRLEELFIDYTS